MRAIACALAVVLVLWHPATLQAQSSETRLSEPRPVDAERLARGVFRDGDPVHRGSGGLEILKTPEGEVVVRLEDLQTVPGPNLLVYLVRDEDPLFPEDVTAAFTTLGGLKARTGDQNYAVPAEIDVREWGSVVVWCDTFKVAFAIATIEAD
jgi:hypothetical protein